MANNAVILINGRHRGLEVRVEDVLFQILPKYEPLILVDTSQSEAVLSAFDNDTTEEVRIHKYSDVTRSIRVGSILREMRVLCCIDHPNILRLLDILIPCEEDEYDEEYDEEEYENEEEEESEEIEENRGKFEDLYLVFESNLYEELSVIPTFEDPTEILFQILKALRYLHYSAGIVHSDLNPSNILISPERTTLKIRGFSKSRTIGEPRYYEQLVEEGSPFDQRRRLSYLPPELLVGCDQHTMSPSVDIWAAACVFLQAINRGLSPFVLAEDVKPTREEQLDRILALLRPKQEDLQFIASKELREKALLRNADVMKIYHHQPSLLDLLFNLHPKLKSMKPLLERMLVFDPTKRINAKEAVKAIKQHEEDNEEEKDFLTSGVEHKLYEDLIWETMNCFYGY